ncbi:NAD-dependent epimerase/dehydratase family protein [Terrilactibacillus sp. BCM23-1]|uniref:NAD-dependent epimerase/dehydratase family protein n=1 Tax=Terrilactibacillus tamarindi TaxID=2599694 RepID=A0A6N8CSE5_9BACI|nr:NAD-dependent epimerase/dehydratase family protein [Terrilactibacillus tamarindi]MTT31855.1 NAD-dependent epimerase/dehydratase family protein [Terrilactibacillus tamarindi]
MDRVIVTGGAGFIGSHIVEALLRENYKVMVIDNFSTGHRRHLEHLPIDVYTFDITNPDVMDLIISLHPDYIIHEAAQISVANSVKDILNDENVNVKGSLHVIKAAIKANVKKVVFASSAAVYGNPITLPVSVDHPTRPESPYGLTKLTVEHYLKMAYKFYGLSYGILRYSNVYGPRQDAKGEGGVVAIFSECMRKETAPTIFGDGKQTRDFIFVRDVASANIKALKVDKNISVNISSGGSITINQLFETMKKAANSHLSVHYADARQGDIRDSLLSNDETKRLLGWAPCVDLFQGLRETIYDPNQYKKLQKL